MKVAYLERIGDDLFFKINDDDDNILKGVVKYNDENELNLADDYYFSRDYGVYKKIDDENREIFFLKSRIFDTLFDIVIDDNYIKLPDSYYPLFYYLDNNQLNFSSDYTFNDKNLSIEVVSYNNDYFYRCFDENGKFVFLFVYYKSVFDYFGEFFDGFVSGLFETLGGYYNSLSDMLYGIKSQLNDINCDIDFSPVLDKLDSSNSYFSQKLKDINSKINCDFSPLEQKLNEINGKFDILKVLDVSKVIDEKLSQVFNLKSLNGSNGSKFRDGESVKVKGYNGEWIVDGSYPILNQDSISIIVYKLKQDDRIILAPAPFVEGV